MNTATNMCKTNLENETIVKSVKTYAQRQKEYRERKKIAKQLQNPKKIPKTNAQYQQQYRENQKKILQQSETLNLARKKKDAERAKRYRDKLKSKKQCAKLDSLPSSKEDSIPTILIEIKKEIDLGHDTNCEEIIYKQFQMHTNQIQLSMNYEAQQVISPCFSSFQALNEKRDECSMPNSLLHHEINIASNGNADPNSGALSVGVPDTASQPEPKKRKKKHVGINCSECKKNVFVFRYACVQCEDYELCGACDAAGAHAHHYLLRIPASRPTSEIAEVVAKVRELMSVEVASAGSSAYLSEYRLGDQFATKLADESPDESGDDFSDENNEAIEEEISVKLEVKEEAGAEDPLQAPAPAAEQSDETEAGPAPKRPRTILKDMLLGVKPEPPSDEEDAQTEVYTLTHTTPLAHMDTTYTQTTNVKLEPGTFYEVFSHQSEFSDQSIDQPSCSVAAGNVPVVSHVAASSHAGGSSQVAGSGHTAVSSQAVRKKSKVAANPKK